jgi:hypothetical protein
MGCRVGLRRGGGWFRLDGGKLGGGVWMGDGGR